MTETPDQPGKEEIRAGKDWTPDENDKLPRVDGTAERIKRWQEAQAEAERTGNTTAAEYNKAMLERIKALKGPNPVQEKAKKLYEWWVSGCGTYPPGNYTRYDDLDEGQKERWAVLAKALGNHPYHDHTRGSLEMKAEKYKNIPAGLSWAEYDNVLHPEESGYSDKYDGVKSYIHDDDLTYEEWVEAQPLQRKYWWQFWRPVEVHTEYEDYCLWIRNNALRRKAGLHATSS